MHSLQNYDREENDDAGPVESDHLFRLFVGWVPKEFSESDLRPYFELVGDVQDLIILREKHTEEPRGCAFVSFATKEQAEKAIEKLDKKIQLPGALSAIEVRFARSHNYVQASSGPSDNRQLFFCRASAATSEEELRHLFDRVGKVEEIFLFFDRVTGVSKGAGLVTMETREQALNAIEVLDGQHMGDSSGPLSISWADPELQTRKKKAVESSNVDNRMVFFAKVLRSATEEEVKSLFSTYGKVYDVNLFRAFQGASTTKGCGLVTMSTHEEAIAAIQALDNQHVWEGMDVPMVVKWMDAALQRRRREQHLAAMRQGLATSMTLGEDAWMPSGSGFYPNLSLPPSSRVSVGMGTSGVLVMGGGGGLVGGAELVQVQESPPAGCDADAIKLFVGNIPKLCTEEQLQPFFETVGKVVELVIVKDKLTHESKGSAFLWYASRMMAERAILQFNLRHVLPDPSGEQDRPLVVRKAKARVKQGIAAMVPHPGAVGMLPGLPMGQPQIMDPRIMDYSSGQQRVQMSAHPAYYGHHLVGQGVQMAAAGPSHHGSSSYQVLPQHGPVMSLQSEVSGIMSQNQVHEGSYSEGRNVNYDESFLPVGATSQQQMQEHVVVSITINHQQLAMINNHMFSVQSMSMAQLNVTSGPPGLFHLVVSGNKDQVETAKTLLGSILSPA
ncbi:hypothetical protein CEUSTIGMA_g130.t1 [Chlamydomonas eustigma]|uniref:RRM domain-containing protein n=1 Tax=Chlamydomonas eustigma TaxID=1157962 RepID=A0A250WPA3_9CHLO|nr:hypothetical protein CEUSTIGMA_g130.t1 [Chlamydomonas eustigma]|eukprot:GAX72674.1 hypothetical protein CEUSTIGMA_g130.t1 [Chlamydomonas eustigma]